MGDKSSRIAYSVCVRNACKDLQEVLAQQKVFIRANPKQPCEVQKTTSSQRSVDLLRIAKPDSEGVS